MPKFNAVYYPKFVDELAKLDNTTRVIAIKWIRRILEDVHLSKPLHGRERRFAERLLAYRIVFQVENDTVQFLRIAKRDIVYVD